jgi:glycosyltransferase involved in cell wall biosynthesis
MASVSALSFVYNEEEHLDACLAALRPHVDEIVIADLESADGTRAIAEKYADKIFDVPWLICGDSYKPMLHYASECDWMLWFYADELFPAKTAEIFRSITETNEFTAFSFMRREYMDDVRLAFRPSGEAGSCVYHGTIESPNYQNRLHKRIEGVFYNGLVHWEVPKQLHSCPMPPEYFFEHRKSSRGQEFDNIRLYIFYHYLSWFYGDTQVEPYAEQVQSYHHIIKQSEAKNLSGERKISLAEEFWWDWRKYADRPRITLDQFESMVGISYPDFIAMRNDGRMRGFTISDDVIDEALCG